MPRPEELRLTEYGSEDSDYDEDIFNNSIIHSYEKKKSRCTRGKICGVTMLGVTLLLTSIVVTVTVYPYFPRSCDTATGLLPGDIIPVHYDLWLYPDLTTLTFQGKVEIQIKVLKRTKCIVLNSLDQNITDIKLKQKDGTLLMTEDFSFVSEHEFLVIPLRAKLEEEEYTLVIEYEAEVRHALKGFYRSYYTTSSGEKRVAAVTQFEASYARHAFPCFDEPQYKATFTISIVRDTEHTALSNMPKNATVAYGKDGLLLDTFEKSVKMSTYLVAFMVMDFTSRSTTTSSNVLIRIWSRSETEHQTEYALECAKKLLEYYEGLFGIPFPLPKQDLVAVPDFNSGAMENWGLITYRETSILYDKKETSNSFKRRVVSVIAHELAHQWFGNLVTMKWWNDLWLNEGFASYMEYVASDVVKPEMGMQMYLQKNGMQRALSADSFSNSHPISSEANNPASIAEMFDAISYRKGACIIRMLNEVLGDKLFYEGINSYLTTYEYSNAEQGQLYTAINETAKHMDQAIDIGEFMGSWTLQMGYPIVHVKLTGENKVQISQTKYKFPGEVETESPLGYKWHIPFWYQTNEETGSNKFLWVSEDSVEFETKENTKWILGNSLARGFYRVNYDAENWGKIIDLLHNSHTVFHEVDRMKIIDDLTSISQVVDDVDITLALEASLYLRNELSLYTLTGSLTSLSRIIGKLAVLEEYGDEINSFFLHIMEPVVKRIGLEPKEDDDFQTGLFRGEILTEVAQHGYQPAVDYAHKLYQEHISTGQQVEANLYAFVYATVAMNCTEKEWEAIFQEYTKESLQSKQRYLMKALASTFNVDIVKKLLKYTMDEKMIRRQDARIVLMHISMGSYPANYATWDFLRENWAFFYEEFGHTNSGFDLLIESVIGQFYKKEDIDEVNKFFDNKDDLGSIERGVKKGLEAASHRREWLKKHKEHAGGWLKVNFPRD
ncbi:endoplasmic reticulum aminopeptidase 1-like [Bolinopsis microptera]|uniref:endoplasmic reticulum aminopeptidase 1-like n=1 Tax=Bolinopsis microptera TaxID=2820187 RepID=UPI003079300D